MRDLTPFLSRRYQVYYLIFSLLQANLSDLLFCSWLLFACEQLQHLKGIMKPLMELSSTLDTYRPNSAALFRSISAGSTKDLVGNEGSPDLPHIIFIETPAIKLPSPSS